MINKTLVVCGSPPITTDLIKDFDEELKENGKSFEGDHFIILPQVCYSSYVPVLKRRGGVSAKDELNELTKYQCEYRYIDHDKYFGSGYYDCFIQLVRRSDIGSIIWYVYEDEKCYFREIDYLRKLVSPILQEEFYCPYSCENRRTIIPASKIEKQNKLLRYISEARASDIAYKFMALYFTRTIQLLYEIEYGEKFETDSLLFEGHLVQGLRMIYSEKNGRYNFGSLIIFGYEKMFERNKLPFCCYNLPNIEHNSAMCIDRLVEYGLIRKNHNTQRLFHTEQGERIYVLLKKYLPEYMKEKNYTRWIKRVHLIRTGRIQEGEYVQETVRFVRKIIDDINREI